jgi:hypothetical protein
MDKVDASNLLRISLKASESEIEAAYRKRRVEVRKRFEATRDRNTRTQCEREYSALEQARNILLAETEDLIKEPEAPPAEREAAPVEREAPPVERETPPVEREAPPVEPEAAPVEGEAAPAEREEPPGKTEALPLEREAAPAERVSPPVERVSSPIERVSKPIKRVSSPIERVSEPIKCVSSSVERVSPPKEPELTPVKIASAQVRTRFTQKQLLAIAGVMFILVSAAVIVFFRPHSPDKSKSGKLVLNTVPDSADVWLDGVFQGKTPLVLENLAPGDCRLKIGLSGYEAQELIVSVKPGDEGSTRIIQLAPAEQSSAASTATQAATSQTDFTIVSPNTTPDVLTSERPSAYPGERYPQTHERLLPEAEIADLNYAELRYAINETYARHGAPFLSEPEIEKQFRDFDWYHPRRDLKLSQIEASFSAIEKKNVEILAHLRDQKRPR